MHLNEILTRELAAHRDRIKRDDLNILETGTIRGATDNYRTGDGWSTLAFADHVRDHGGSFTSIDLDIDVSQAVVAEHELTDYVKLVKGYSIDVLANMVRWNSVQLDVVLLDSDNDSNLILHEYLVVRQLIRPGGIVLVDDVSLESTDILKGHTIVPWFDTYGTKYRIETRHADGYQIGVLVAEL